MEYSNPELPEGINTSKTHPLKEFVILTVGLLGLIFLSISALVIIVDNFADKIPFAMESKLPVSNLFEDNHAEKLPPYLQTLTQKVLHTYDLPDDMHVTFHYVNDDTVNAFATLGGHIVLYRGLIEKLQYEDELAMVIAHEISHIKHRHPILSVSHGIVVGIALTAVSSSIGNSIISDLIGTTGTATVMRFSRKFESQADKDAVKSLIKLYGHAEGALGLFKILEKEDSKMLSFELLATHPLTKNRISQVVKMNNQDSVVHNGNMIKYPQDFKLWLHKQHEEAQGH